MHSKTILRGAADSRRSGARIDDDAVHEIIENDSGPGKGHCFTKSARSAPSRELREYDGHLAYVARQRVIDGESTDGHHPS